jgi:hypothetical protein
MALLFGGILAGPAAGADTAAGPYRVVLKSGEVLPEVGFTADYRFRVLRLSGAAEGRAISFADVASIHAGDRDVTEEILTGTVPRAASPSDSGVAPAEPGAWRSEKSAEYKAATAPRWRGAIRGGGNYSIPIGDYYTGFEPGIGFDFDAMLVLSRGAALGARVSKSGIKLEEPFASLFDATVMRYSLSGVGYKHLSDAPGDRSMVYGTGGLGLVNHKLSLSSAGISAGDSDLMLTTGIGIIKTLGSSVGVDARVTADEVFGSIGGSSQIAFILDFGVGLIVLF